MSQILPETNNNNIQGVYMPLEWLETAPPAQEFSIDPLAPIGAVTLINAHGGTGKSLLALKIATHIVLGIDILGAETNGEKVAYMSLEDSEDILRRRIYKLIAYLPKEVQGRRQELSDRLMFIDGYGRQMHVAKYNQNNVEITDITNKLIKLLKKENIKTLFVDTFVRSHSLNENDNAQMGALLVAFEKIAAEAKCAVILLHHLSKSSDSKAYAARGASAITDNARSSILLERVDKKDETKFSEADIKMAVTEGRLIRVMHIKHNYSVEHPEQYIEITKDGGLIERYPSFDIRKSSEQRLMEISNWQKKEMKGKPITKTNIDENFRNIRPENTNYSKWIYRNALDWGIENSYVQQVASPEGGSRNKNAVYYIINMPQ
ncbi:hypothetical protein ADMFC3_19180 [Geovibrio sp. ADMFC3]